MVAEFERRNREMARLFARIAERDEDALSALYDLTSRQLYGLLLRVVGDAATAEEVLFDLYVQVWRQAARYEAARGTPLAWLVMMARSRALDRLRSGRGEARDSEPLEEAREAAPAASPEEEAAHSEMRRIVHAALVTLPPEQREVIELAYYQGMSQTEIASALGQPLGTVKSRARRAMIKLKGVLSPVIEGIL